MTGNNLGYLVRFYLYGVALGFVLDGLVKETQEKIRKLSLKPIVLR
jgi:hypothetical protein